MADVKICHYPTKVIAYSTTFRPTHYTDRPIGVSDTKEAYPRTIESIRPAGDNRDERDFVRDASHFAP